MPVRLDWCLQTTLDGCEVSRFWHRNCELGVFININLNLRNHSTSPRRWCHHELVAKPKEKPKLTGDHARTPKFTNCSLAYSQFVTTGGGTQGLVDRTLDRHDWMNFVQHTCRRYLSSMYVCTYLRVVLGIYWHRRTLTIFFFSSFTSFTPPLETAVL